MSTLEIVGDEESVFLPDILLAGSPSKEYAEALKHPAGSTRTERDHDRMGFWIYFPRGCSG